MYGVRGRPYDLRAEGELCQGVVINTAASAGHHARSLRTLWSLSLTEQAVVLQWSRHCHLVPLFQHCLSNKRVFAGETEESDKTKKDKESVFANT